MISSIESIRRELISQGMIHSVSEQSSSGRYQPFDVEWNYNDVPHLEHVHDLVDGIVVSVSSDYIASIFLQRIGPFRLPIAVFNQSIDRRENLYFSSLGPFVLVINTTWKLIDVKNTVVTTSYHLFSSRWLKLAHKAVHRVLGRNYRVLMSADLPMRERRGELRDLGYRFVGDVGGNGFAETVNVRRRNLIAPANVAMRWTVGIDSVPIGRSFIGGRGKDGLVVVRGATSVHFFPRTCDHEGALLDTATLINGCLACPWHGRKLSSVAEIDLATGSITKLSTDFGAKLEARTLEIWWDKR